MFVPPVSLNVLNIPLDVGLLRVSFPSSADIFCLTMTAILPLHTAGALRASPMPAGLQHRDQVGELEEIRDTERRPPGGYHHERIVRDRICPTRRDFSEPAFVVVEVHPVASPTVAVRDELVLSAE